MIIFSSKERYFYGVKSRIVYDKMHANQVPSMDKLNQKLHTLHTEQCDYISLFRRLFTHRALTVEPVRPPAFTTNSNFEKSSYKYIAIFDNSHNNPTERTLSELNLYMHIQYTCIKHNTRYIRREENKIKINSNQTKPNHLFSICL